jgi:hypothetical protein
LGADRRPTIVIINLMIAQSPPPSWDFFSSRYVRIRTFIEGKIGYLQSLVAEGREIHLLVILLQLLQVFDDVLSFSGGGVKKFAPIRKYSLGCLRSVGILEIRPDLVCAVAHRGIQPSAIV